MEDLFVQIASIKQWLREKPHAGQVEKSEMISRLRDLNERLNKVKEVTKLLNKGKL